MAGATSLSLRASAPPEGFALDCSTGSRTPASAGTLTTLSPSVSGSARQASSKRCLGFRKSAVTGPGISAASARRVFEPSSGSASSADSSSKNMTAADLSGGLPLSAYSRSIAVADSGSQASP
jgi:hypothetical protein